MWRWMPKITWTKSVVVDALATLVVGLMLCATLFVYSTYRLRASDWWPEVHGLSEDGSYYLSLCRAGIRVHEVSSGKEVDRYTLRYPWESTGELVDQELNFYHPLELAAPRGVRQDSWQLDPEQQEAALRPKVLLSPSRRYFATLFPAGYALIWDRETDRYRCIAEPEYFFEHLSFEESRGVFFIELKRRPSEKVIFGGGDLFDEEPNASKDRFAKEIVSYRLHDFSRLGVETVSYAGNRIQGNRNLRLIEDVEQKELRVILCDEFPYGSHEVIRRVSREDLSEFCQRSIYANQEDARFDEFPPSLLGIDRLEYRMVDDELYLVSRDGSIMDFGSYLGKNPIIRRIHLPDSGSHGHRRWIANGMATVDSNGDEVVAIWDDDMGVAIFEVPPASFGDGVELQGADSFRKVRVAGSGGEVVDFPVGADAPVVKHQMNLTAHHHLPLVMTCFVAVIGTLWLAWGCLSRSLFRKRSWLVLILICLWPSAFWATEFLVSSGSRGSLLYSLVWLMFGLVAAIAGIGILAKEGASRSVIICGCALFAMLMLSEAPSRLTAPFRQQQFYGGGSIGCFSGFGFTSDLNGGTSP